MKTIDEKLDLIQSTLDFHTKKWEENDKKWEESDKKWKENNKKWEESNKKWEENNKKWEENNKKWEESNKKWEKNDVKWEKNDNRLDILCAKVEGLEMNMKIMFEEQTQTMLRLFKEAGTIKDYGPDLDVHKTHLYNHEIRIENLETGVKNLYKN